MEPTLKLTTEEISKGGEERRGEGDREKGMTESEREKSERQIYEGIRGLKGM